MCANTKHHLDKARQKTYIRTHTYFTLLAVGIVPEVPLVTIRFLVESSGSTGSMKRWIS